MVLYQGIKATMRRFDDDERYSEHKCAKGTAADPRKGKEIFVEATSGERFYVTVEITPKFNFKSSTHVEIAFSVDGCEKEYDYMSTEDVIESKRRGAIARRQCELTTVCRMIDNKWSSCGLVFADLKLDEMSDPSDEQIAQDLDLCGCVSVEITRGTATLEEPVEWKGTQIEATEVSSKDVVKKNHVSHATKFLQLEDSEPPVDSWEFVEAEGKAGEPFVLKLRYRSRDSLELLGVVPRNHVDPVSAPPNGANVDSAAAVRTKRPSAPGQSSNDDEQPPLRKIKREGELGVANLNPSIQGELPVPDLNTETRDDLKDRKLIGAPSTAPAINSWTSTSVNQVAAPIVIKDEDDDLQILDFRPAPRSQAAATPAATAPVTNGGEQADRERKKALLKLRLEQLKIEQELMEMRD